MARTCPLCVSGILGAAIGCLVALVSSPSRAASPYVQDLACTVVIPSGCGTATVSIPARTRVVIENVNFRCSASAPLADAFIEVHDSGRTHFYSFPSVSAAKLEAGVQSLSNNETKIYLGPSATYYARFTLARAANGKATNAAMSCLLTLSGEEF